jgi:23S rRNA (cytosine1962-C5)-methyltransferase
MVKTPISYSIRLKKGKEKTILSGMPWVYASDIIESSELMLLPAGDLVAIETHKGQFIGIGYFNAHSQIACRVLALQREAIDVAFFKKRFEAALATREKLAAVPYYRLVHSEADGLPGLLIDRFGDACVVQVGTAGMEALQPLWMAALEQVIAPKAIVLRNDFASRGLEGMGQGVSVFKGEISPLVEVHENGCIYLADLIKGQKTGWFYDQRDNRRMMAGYSKDKTVVDIYSHSGGFGLLAAKEGAVSVTLVDSSALALDSANQAAARNGVESRLFYRQGDAFAVMEQMGKNGETFDIVLADPPAFVKTKKDMTAGLKGYEKVARLATRLVKEGGLLFVASCSHHAQRQQFNKAVQDGVAKAGRKAKLLKQTGAAADHPRHAMLRQNEYLKGILLQLQD